MSLILGMSRVFLPPLPQIQIPSLDQVNKDVITGITRELIRSNDITLKQMESSSSSKSKWSRTSPLSKAAYLKACIKVDGTVTDEPTPFMQIVLAANNMSEAEQIIQHKFADFNTSTRPALCTAIYNCIFFSPEDGNDRKNFTTYFMPSCTHRSEGKNDDEKKRSLFKAPSFVIWRTMQKTATAMINIIFGEDSGLYFVNAQYQNHATSNEKYWLKNEETDGFTGPKAQLEHDRIMHRFFESCMLENEPRIDVLKNDILFTQIENGQFGNNIRLLTN
mmetsp:Transcript_38779/g.47247  ORF Transcript_38779/g.47247 Transcript_38779/m.47247 type:complete len:277 (-) Transcript_38779:414-1244(-)